MRKRKKLSLLQRFKKGQENKKFFKNIDKADIPSISNKRRKLKLRKNFFPTLLAIVFLWITLFFLVYFVEPNKTGAIPFFFALLFLSFLFTFSMLFANTRRGFIAAAGIVLFAFLRFVGVGSAFNFILILGLLISVEVYLSHH